MSAFNDPSTHAPDGSFFNFAHSSDRYRAGGAEEYYRDVVLEVSPTLTDDNMDRVERAAADLKSRLSSAGPFRLDEAVQSFQSIVGDELLSELRAGVDEINLFIEQGSDNLFNAAFTRDLDLAVFRGRVRDGNLGVLFSPNPNGLYSEIAAQVIQPVVVQHHNEKRIDLSRFATYLSNAAVWMQRGTAPDMGVVHSVSNMLARHGEEDRERSRRRINEAIAVIAAEHVRRPAFLTELVRYDGTEESYAEELRSAIWQPEVVSLAHPRDRLLYAHFGRRKLADIVQLCVDNPLTRADVPRRRNPVSIDDLFVPRLITTGTRRINSNVFTVVNQTRTTLLPSGAVRVVLDPSTGDGFVALHGRTSRSHPCLLLPADERSEKFLLRVYGSRVPGAMTPLGRMQELLRAFRFDPMQLLDVLTQFGVRLPWAVSSNLYAIPHRTYTRMAFTGSHDLGAYVPGSERTGIILNEITIY